MPNLPWNEEDSDCGGWGDLLAGVILAGLGTAMFVAGLTGHGGRTRGGTPVAPSVIALAGLAFLAVGSLLAIRGYGFNYSDWRDRRHARQRRRARSRTRRR